ncbi:MAG TPA: EAL domain-containing protein [Cellulomonas sp.]
MSGRTAGAVAAGAGAWVVLVVAAAVLGAQPAVYLLAAVTCGVAAVAAQRRMSARPVRELRAWRWFAPVGGVLAVGFSAEALIGLLGSRASVWAGTGLMVGTLAACVLLYEATQYWNRYSIDDWDPGEWITGIGGLLGATALVTYLTYRVAHPEHSPSVRMSAENVQVAALVILLPAVGTVIATANLRRDWRAWTLFGLLAVLSGLTVLRYICTVRGHAPSAVLISATVCAWVALGLMIAAAGLAPRVPHDATFVTSRASAIGALLVVAGGGAIIVIDVFAPSGQRAVPVLAAMATLVGSLRLVRAVSDLSELASARREARTDGLTGIPNRRALIEHLEGVLGRSGRAALLMVDLDEFKGINDGMGHAAGDQLIRAVAARLAAETGDAGLLARLGGDEFAVVLHEPDPVHAQRVARTLLAAVRAPVLIDGSCVQVEASIGVASTVLEATTVNALLRGADAAMYAAKRSGGGVQVYDRVAAALTERRGDLLSDLRTLLTGGPDAVGSLVLHYQPQLACEGGGVVGVEALVRWQHPRHGLLAPVAFLDLVEDHRLMPHLTRVVVEQAVREASGWRDTGWDLPVSVNLSASCLANPDLLDELSGALGRAGLPADRLVLEMTETAIMDDPAQAVAMITAISGSGIKVSIDDYGTGYSSLTYLDQLPAHELKLDRSFTTRLLEDERTKVIVSGTIGLAHRLGLIVTAEGVEDLATAVALQDFGCDRTQGYLHSRPLPAAEFREWLRAAHTPRLPAPRSAG